MIKMKDLLIAENAEIWYDDYLDLKRKYRNKSVVPDEVSIMAAKELSRKYKIRFQDILKKLTPNQNLSNSKSWDRYGNIIRIK